MADLRLCNELAFRISLSFFKRFGISPAFVSRVAFLSADVRGSRHRDSQHVRIACSHQVETLRNVQETCLFHRIHQTWPHPIHERQLMTQQENQGPQLPQRNQLQDSQHVRAYCAPTPGCDLARCAGAVSFPQDPPDLATSSP